MHYARIALASALVLALAACDRRDEHDDKAATAAANDSATPSDAAPAAAPAPMSVTPTDARVASITKKTTDCNLESANGSGFEPDVPTASRAKPIVVSGWLVDATAGKVPEKTRIRLEAVDGTQAWEQPITEWGDRGDVVSARGNNAAFQKSGFNVTLDVGALEAGPYEIYLNYDTPDGEVSCAVGRRLALN